MLKNVNEKYDLDEFINDEYIRNFFKKKMALCALEIESLVKELKKNPEEESIELKIKVLIEKLSRYEQCVKIINSTCQHNLVLHLGKVDPNESDKGYAVCLMCKEEFSVDGIDYDPVIFSENVINVDGILSPIYTNTFDGNENVLVRRAREKLLEIAFSKQDTPFEEVKEIILEDLVYYTDELEKVRVIPRRRKKKISGGI